LRQVVLRVRADAAEDALDALLPRLFDGVHVRPAGPAAVDLIAFGRTHPLPECAELARLAARGLIQVVEGEAPDAWSERRRMLGGGGAAVAGRVWLRSPVDPAPSADMLDVVIDRRSAFGTGAHPTTRMCIEMLLRIPVAGGFADLGCGAGALAVVAAKLGFAPVHAVDYSEESVATARANAARNGVAVAVSALDLIEQRPPAAPVVAANVPAPVHVALAGSLPASARAVIVSGITPPDREATIAAYARAGLVERDALAEGGWLALLLERDRA
jgi:ribosomal protein L11 methyltransferase